MTTIRSRIPLLVGTMALVATTTAGCIYSEKERIVQAPPPPPTTVVAQVPTDRVVTYPEGRWTLYGDGTTAAPHYWVWVPAGTAPPPPPPLPRR
ncbi:MAG TPA: hypothetical protein VID28_24100 [Methylomirabilota bacterium]|jgi:hypothetical protein